MYKRAFWYTRRPFTSFVHTPCITPGARLSHATVLPRYSNTYTSITVAFNVGKTERRVNKNGSLYYYSWVYTDGPASGETPRWNKKFNVCVSLCEMCDLYQCIDPGMLLRLLACVGKSLYV